MNEELEKLRELTKTITRNGYLSNQTQAWKYAFDSVDELVCITNLKFQIKFINKSLGNKLGITALENYINADLSSILPEKLFLDNISNWRIDDLNKVYSDIYIKELNGWYKRSKHAITSNSGKLIGYTFMLSDITSRKLIEEDLKKSQAIAHVGSWRLDLASNQVTWSEELYKMYNLNPEFPPPPFTEHQKLFTPESWEKLTTFIQNTVETNKPYKLELETVREDGSNGWMWVRGETVLDEDGTIVGLYGAAQDITERKQAEEKLRASEEIFRSTISDLLVGVVVHAADSSILVSNSQANHILGLNKEHMVGKQAVDPAWHFVHEDLSVMKVENYPVSRVISTGKGIANQILGIKRPDREEITWVSLSAVPVFSDKKVLSRIITNFMDITERKQAEEELLNEKSFSEAIIESIPGMLYVYDDQGTHILHNKKHEEMTGYSAEELSLLNPLSWYDDKADILRVEAAISDVFTKGFGEVEAPMQIKNGEKLMMHFTGSKLVMNGKKYFVGVGTDITDRKRVENMLKESEERYKELFMNMGSGVAIYEVKGDAEDFIFKDFNKAAEKIDKQRKEELIGRSIFEARPQVKDFGLIDAFREVWKTGKPKHLPVNFYNDGKISAWYENFIYKLPSGEIVSIFTDKTEHKQVEQTLAGVLNAIPDIISVQDENGTIIEANSTAKEFFKLTSKDIGTIKCYQLLGRTEPCTECQTVLSKTSKSIAIKERYIKELDSWYDCRSYPILDSNNNVIKVIEHLRKIEK